MWIVMHEDLKTTTRCRVVFDALVEGLARYVANDKAAAEASCKT
jgi:hypothetical protein